jgi:hypothetical protein
MTAIKTKSGYIEFHENPFCEHCGELEPYDPTLQEGEDAGYITWCMDCAWANELATKAEIDKAEELAKPKKKKYYEEKLKENS